MSNKSRKDARAAVQLVARYRSPTVFSFVEERCYDISKGGMFIGSSSPASVGTLLKLECDEESGDKLQAVARVVWTRDSSDDFGPAGMGVKFVKIEKGGSQVLERMLDGRASLVDGGERYRGSLAPPPPASEPPTTSAATSEAPAAKPASASTQPGETSASEQPAAAAATSDRAPEDNASTSERPSQPTGETVAANVRRDSKRPASMPAASSRPPLGKNKSDWTLGLAAAAVLLIAVLFQSMRSGDSDEERPAASNANEAQAEPAAEQKAPAEPAAAAPEEPSKPPEANQAAEVEAPVGEVPDETDTEQAAEGAQPEGTAEEAETAEPETAEAAEAPAEPATAAEAEAPPEVEEKAAKAADDSAAEPAPGSYVVTVITRPGGARVTLRGKELYAPGDFTFTNFPEPSRIEADKVGFRPTAGTVDPKDFELDEGLMKRRIYLVLKPEE